MLTAYCLLSTFSPAPIKKKKKKFWAMIPILLFEVFQNPLH